MSTSRYDVGIVGLGALGAATAWQLAARGARVAGFDRHRPPHALGSTHGRSRIIREAYFEHPLYVPIVQRAYALWADLEAAAGTRLFQACGGLMIGHPESALFRGARTSADWHALPVQEWTAPELAARVPGLTVPGDMVALFEPRAGVLDPERAVTAMLRQAEALGASLVVETPVAGWEPEPGGIALRLADGARVACARIVLAAGGWLAGLAQLDLPLTIERAIQYWFPTGGDPRFAPAAFPVFILESPAGRWLYGLPDRGHGLKLAEHHGGWTGPLDALPRTVSDGERDDFRAFAAHYVVDLPPRSSEASVCFYTNTPDDHFLLDRHPRHRAVYLASACSGHGFKFAPALGELIAEDLTAGSPIRALEPFRLSRFR